MDFAIRNSYEASILLIYLQAIVMIAFDRAVLKVRIQPMLGDSARIPPIVLGAGFVRTFSGFYLVVVAQMTNLFSRHQERVRHADSPAWQWLLIGAFAILVLAVSVAMVAQARGLKSLKEYGVSRGKLRAGLESLARKARFLLPGSMPLYVLPELDFQTLCKRAFLGVAVPRQLLDQLSRNEIQSLLARQLAPQSPRIQFLVFAPTVVFNCCAIGAAWAGHIGSLATGLLFLSLVAVELLALHLSQPWLTLCARLYSIQLTGNAEAFFSAQGSLNRFGGAPIPNSILQRIGRREGVSPDRINALMAEHPAPPEEERYPTTGSYMDTGL